MASAVSRAFQQERHWALSTRAGRRIALAGWMGWLVAVGPGCGKVGDPLPPAIQRPQTISDLRVTSRARATQLIFSLPGDDVRQVEVYRMCPPLVVEERSSLIARLGQDELVEFGETNRFVFEDRDRAARVACRYALRFVNRQGYQSEFSNFASRDDTDRP